MQQPITIMRLSVGLETKKTILPFCFTLKIGKDSKMIIMAKFIVSNNMIRKLDRYTW